MKQLRKYTVVMNNLDKSEKKEVFAQNETQAISKADPKRKYKKYSVYQNAVAIWH